MSAPSKFQLSADFPHGALPEVFGIITAANPPGRSSLNGLPGMLLGDALRVKEWSHYPADVVLPNSDEPRVSFAVVENLSKLERLARDFMRPAIFWVQRGEVLQTFFGQRAPKPLGMWDNHSGRPPVKLHAQGNLALLDHPATAFLCSTVCPGEKSSPLTIGLADNATRAAPSFPDFTPLLKKTCSPSSPAAVPVSSGHPPATFPKPLMPSSNSRWTKVAFSSSHPSLTANPPAPPRKVAPPATVSFSASPPTARFHTSRKEVRSPETLSRVPCRYPKMENIEADKPQATIARRCSLGLKV